MNITDPNNRILIVDDSVGIHEDFRKILGPGRRDFGTALLEHAILGTSAKPTTRTFFETASAHQGQEALAMVEAAVAEGRPYAVAFVDVRMPPGWDGIETIARIWEKDPAIQIVVCTAYSDYSWDEIVEKLGCSDQLVILKKPFDNVEVLQLAHAMSKKWMLTRQVLAKLGEHEQTQVALRLSEERLANAFAACPMPVAILQVFGQRVLQANPALLAAADRSAEEIIGQPIWAAGIDASEEFLRSVSARLFRGEALRRHECAFRTKSGDVRRGLLWLEPFDLAAGPHVLAILQDVTDQSLLESQLRQAQKMEAVGHLAAGVAHDFNNLLTVIHGHSSMRLRSPGLDRKVADSLAAVQQAAERAAELTRQLLTFSRKQVLEKGSLCLDSVVTNVSGMLRRLIPESIHIHFGPGCGRATFYGDRCNIEQVLLNLVVNARDAMAGGGEIFVATEIVEFFPGQLRLVTERRAGKFVCLEVRDTGSGMDEATMLRIFEPFFTTKEAGKGTGMGLATVHGIVKQHDGWIEVASTPGNGTTFRVFLPQVEAAVEAPTAQRSTISAPMRGRTVLFAEDDGDVRELVREVLKEAGVRVIESPNGREALGLWKAHSAEIDLLLTDMVMPGGISGAELADLVLADRPDLPIIYSSGYSVSLFNEDRKIREDVNYLPKPYLAHQLTTIVASALARGKDSVPKVAAAAA